VPAEPVPCANCGVEVPIDEGYCPSCGTALGTRLCSNGHVMDAAWTECKYCSAKPANEGRAPRDEPTPEPSEAAPDTGESFGSRATLLGTPSEGTWSPGEATGHPQEHQHHEPDGARGPSSSTAPKHRTVYDPGLVPEALKSPGKAAPGPGTGRLVGWLVSFSLDPSGVDFRLREGRNSVGSDPDCDVVIEGARGVSGKHAIVMYRKNQVQIRDNDSTNGTYVNGRDIFGQGALKIETGDRIRLGHVELVLHLL